MKVTKAIKNMFSILRWTIRANLSVWCLTLGKVLTPPILRTDRLRKAHNELGAAYIEAINQQAAVDRATLRTLERE